MRKPILSPERNKGGNQPLMKGPFFIFLLLMPAFLFLIFLILMAMQYKQLRSLVAPNPQELPQIPTSPESQARVRVELDSFLAPAPPQGAPRNAHDTLALDAAGLNDLIRGSAALEKSRLDYHLSLEDTLLVARNSLPVERLNRVLATTAKLFYIRGYLNSEMKGYPKLEDGKLYLIPVAAKMNGITVPATVLSSKGKIEAREWVADKDAFDRAIAHLAEVKIRGGRLLLIRG